MRLGLAASALALTLAAAATLPATAAAGQGHPAQAGVRYRSVAVGGIKLFYREAGDPAKPAILLLHGFPASSHRWTRRGRRGWSKCSRPKGRSSSA